MHGTTTEPLPTRSANLPSPQQDIPPALSLTPTIPGMLLALSGIKSQQKRIVIDLTRRNGCSYVNIPSEPYDQLIELVQQAPILGESVDPTKQLERNLIFLNYVCAENDVDGKANYLMEAALESMPGLRLYACRIAPRFSELNPPLYICYVMRGIGTENLRTFGVLPNDPELYTIIPLLLDRGVAAVFNRDPVIKAPRPGEPEEA